MFHVDGDKYPKKGKKGSDDFKKGRTESFWV